MSTTDLERKVAARLELAAKLKAIPPELRIKVIRELLRRHRQDELLSGSKPKNPDE
jgi:hypothetical protein